MLLNLLLALEIIVSVLLVIVVLLQRSEGGVLGVGGGPSGFVTARGAGDLMTRMTWILGTLFFVLALGLTLLAGRERGASSVVDRLKIDPINPQALTPPPQPAQPAQGQPGAPFQAPAPTVHNPFLGEPPAGQPPAQQAPSKP